MLDLHTHILPGVDDGPDTLAEAVAVCRMAAADGTTEMVATSHQNHASWPNVDLDLLRSRFAEVDAALGGTPILHLGAEIAVDSHLMAALTSTAPFPFLPLGDTRWLLLELPPIELGPSPREVVHEAVVAGWKPLLAHVERIPYLAEDLDRVADLVGLGARIQITANSLTGAWGSRAHNRSHELVNELLVHVVSSDAHNAHTRPPHLGAARNHLESKIGRDAAELLLVTNPRAILSDLAPEGIGATASTNAHSIG